MAYLPPEVATHNDQCVRGLLGALEAVAARTDCTVLLVRHLEDGEEVLDQRLGVGRLELLRRELDFIKRHIFPGGNIPSVTALLTAATRAESSPTT